MQTQLLGKITGCELNPSSLNEPDLLSTEYESLQVLQGSVNTNEGSNLEYMVYQVLIQCNSR